MVVVVVVVVVVVFVCISSIGTGLQDVPKFPGTAHSQKG